LEAKNFERQYKFDEAEKVYSLGQTSITAMQRDYVGNSRAVSGFRAGEANVSDPDSTTDGSKLAELFEGAKIELTEQSMLLRDIKANTAKGAVTGP
jgi:hypothetical protein